MVERENGEFSFVCVVSGVGERKGAFYGNLRFSLGEGWCFFYLVGISLSRGIVCLIFNRKKENVR